MLSEVVNTEASKEINELASNFQVFPRGYPCLSREEAMSDHEQAYSVTATVVRKNADRILLSFAPTAAAAISFRMHSVCVLPIVLTRRRFYVGVPCLC